MGMLRNLKCGGVVVNEFRVMRGRKTRLLCERDRGFESGFLQRRVTCEPEFLDQTRKVIKCSGAIIDLYYWTTPNGHKVTIFLKETGLAYRILPVNISKGEQFKPDFLRISQRSDPCDRRHRSGGGRPAGP